MRNAGLEEAQAGIKIARRISITSDMQMKVKVKVKSLSCVRLFATPWIVAHQAPLSMGFSRQEYWSGLPFPSPGDLPDPGMEPVSAAHLLHWQVDSLPLSQQGSPYIHLQNPGSDSCTREQLYTVLGWQDSLEEGMVTYSSIPAWRIPWTEDPGRLQSIALHRVRHD